MTRSVLTSGVGSWGQQLSAYDRRSLTYIIFDGRFWCESTSYRCGETLKLLSPM